MSPPPPLSINPADFDPDAISPESRAFEPQLRELFEAITDKWWVIGPAEYRRRRKEGAGLLPPPVLLDSARPLSIPSREPGRSIPCRLLRPRDGRPPRGVYMHLHGGGWVLGDEEGLDVPLQALADEEGVACVSVGYRLAPEHRFPAGPEDCFDAAEWLVLNAESELGGGPLAFIGGESAGGHLTALTALHLLRHPDGRFSGHRLAGLVFHYACFTCNFTPAARHMESHEPFVTLTNEDMTHFRDAFLPEGWGPDKYELPELSPLFADLAALRGRLPPALFTCGTKDCLLDDTLFMSARWASAGGEAIVDIVPGAHHGYSLFLASLPGSGADRAAAAVNSFMSKRL